MIIIDVSGGIELNAVCVGVGGERDRRLPREDRRGEQEDGKDSHSRR
jgi:hypothetical protein